MSCSSVIHLGRKRIELPILFLSLERNTGDVALRWTYQRHQGRNWKDEDSARSTAIDARGQWSERREEPGWQGALWAAVRLKWSATERLTNRSFDFDLPRPISLALNQHSVVVAP